MELKHKKHKGTHWECTFAIPVELMLNSVALFTTSSGLKALISYDINVLQYIVCSIISTWRCHLYKICMKGFMSKQYIIFWKCAALQNVHFFSVIKIIIIWSSKEWFQMLNTFYANKVGWWIFFSYILKLLTVDLLIPLDNKGGYRGTVLITACSHWPNWRKKLFYMCFFLMLQT